MAVPRWTTRSAHALARWGGPAITAMGVVVALAWLVGYVPLQSLVPGFATMKFNTAVAFMALGLSAWLDPIQARGARAAAGIAILLGAVAVLEYVVGIDLGINTLIVDDPDSAYTPYPGRMSPVTAVSFVVAGATMFIGKHASWGQWHRRHVLALIVLAMSLTAVTGFVFGTQAFFGASRFTTGMAVHTAAGFGLWSLSILAMDPSHGPFGLLTDQGATGVVARRVIPVALIAPFAIGLFFALGLRRGWFDAPFALAGQAIAVPLIFLSLLIVTLHVSGTFERSRDQARAQRRLAQRRFREERDAFKADFLNRAAHELATPLTPILLRLQILEMFIQEHGGDMEKQSIKVVQRNLQRLRDIVDDLVEASRVDARVASLEAADIPLADVAADVVAAFTQRAEAAGIRLRLHAVPVTVQGDDHAVREVIERLLDNALKFTPAGGLVEVRVHDEGEPTCEVRDNGRGMTPDARERLFQTFSQAHDPMELIVPGTGMGLYLAKLLIEAQGGRLDFDSPGPGLGTRFWFTLP